MVTKKNAQENLTWDSEQQELPFDSADIEVGSDASDVDVDANDESIVLEVQEPGEEKEVIEFMLPPTLTSPIPGAPEDIEITDEGDDEIEVDGDEGNDEVEVEQDPWDWRQSGGPGRFIEWVMHMLQHMPGHSGYDSMGIERCISYLQRLEKEFSKAMREDFSNQIDVAKAEKLRDGVLDAVEKLLDRLEQVEKTKPGAKRKQKKKGPKSASWYEHYGIVKEAGATKITGITVVVPLLISRLARVCINSMVSAGHDIEDEYEKQVKAFKLDNREQAELQQLLEDMGYPLRIDRGAPPGTPVDPSSSNNSDWASQYPG